MAMEKSIIKSSMAAKTTFDYKPRELGAEPSFVAKSFVNEVSFQSTDFKISELIAEQVGISQLESDAHQDKINSQVLEKLKEVQEQAYQEGYQLGLIEGTEKAFVEAKADLIDRLQSLEKLLKRVEDLKSRLLIDNEAGLIQLVFHTARKIALRDLKENPAAVMEILKDVIGEMQENERVTVYLSAQDLQFVESFQAKSGQKIESLQRVKFIADEALTSGGCRIETDYGSVNATVEERVDRTWQTLAGRIPQQTPEKIEKTDAIEKSDKPDGSES